ARLEARRDIHADALVIALRSLRIGKGDEVITSPFTFFATAESINEVGARPVFCDISPDTYNLDPRKVVDFLENYCDQSDKGIINRATGGLVKAVLPVHLYGLMAEMTEFRRIQEKYGLELIEDAAQAFGAAMELDGRSDVKAGSCGDVGCFSFYPSKNLGGAGDGGMIVTNRDDIHELAKVIHVHGSRQRYHHSEFGYNSRLDSFQAAILLVKLASLDKWIDMRIKNAESYNSIFANKLKSAGIPFAMSADLPPNGKRDENAVILPSCPAGFKHTYNTYEIRTPKRDSCVEFLASRGVGNMIYYPVPLHLQDVFEYLKYSDGDLPVTEAISTDILALPQYPELGSDAIEYVVESIVEFLKKK
ncbi:MAG TPA: DegT/DnrJ/EryC1/StrS family aminotransferase, partial [bacterium]|nr:DegT/DnrJ/EryC1/StrS family aminotransferase [bacterium]